MKIYIIGAGVGEESYLTQYALEKIKGAEIVVATKRLFEKLSHLNANMVCCEISEIDRILNDSDKKTAAVLASGDIGFYSIARSLSKKLLHGGKKHELEQISGISSLQYLTARLQTPYDDVKIVSVHGRSVDPIPYICYNKRVFLLTGGDNSASSIIEKMVKRGLANVLVTVGENLSDYNERIITDYANKLTEYKFDSLCVMLIENEKFVNHHEKIYDSEFIRGKSPMTKEAVRTLSLSYLEIKPYENVADIGAGTGSCSIEMARLAYEGSVYALERQEEATQLIRQNIAKFGAYNIIPINAQAPNGIDEMQKIDKAFIGGSGGSLKEILDALFLNNSKLHVVINAITLETLNEAKTLLEIRGITPYICCINASVSEKIGGYSMMKAQNPIYIICGVAAGEGLEHE